MWQGRAILYGCGDLLNDYEGIGGHGNLRCDLGCLYVLTLDAAGALQRLELEPLQLHRFRLEPADATGRSWLLSVFNEGGRAFGTRMQTTAQGSFVMGWQ